MALHEAPSPVPIGTMYVDMNTGETKAWNGSKWLITSTTAGVATLDDSGKIPESLLPLQEEKTKIRCSYCRSLRISMERSHCKSCAAPY